MQQWLRTINELAAEVKATQVKEDDQRKLDKKIRLEFNYNSNHIEGNTLTYGETELLLIFGKTEGQHEFREYEEMEAHDAAFKMIQDWATNSERPLTETTIKNLNELLLVKPYWKDAVTLDGQPTRRQIKVGDYKEYPNHVQLQNGEMFYYATPAKTPIQMGELISWYRSEEEKKELHPVALAALLHYKFVRIHPFDDGNGRISRLLMNYVLLRNDLPPVIIKSADKKNYLFVLNQADTGNMEAFITYIAEQLIWSLQLYIRAAKGESLDEPGDLDKKLFLLKKKLGEDVDDRIQYKKSKEAIIAVLDNALLPLVSKWEEHLQKFEVLFTARNVTLKVLKFRSGDKNLLALTNKLQQLILNRWSEISNLENIELSAYFTKLRYKENNEQMWAGRVIVSFNENTYEVTYASSDKKINKLYHQPLTEEEISTITESLGNWFYQKVEQALIE